MVSATAADVRARTGQTFAYHTCQLICSWDELQQSLNDTQRDLEALYGPGVELVSLYRKFTTKGAAQVMVAVFKVFLGLPPPHTEKTVLGR